jgi:alpha-1,2-mannosyltransferase
MKKGILIAVLIVISIFFIYQIVEISKLPLKTNFIDFKVYYFASQLTKNGENPYKTSLIQEVLTANDQPLWATRFLYPMTFALLFVPFTFFSLESATYIWLLFNALLIVFSFYLLDKIIKNKNHLIWLITSVAIFAFFNPLYYTLKLGQINIVILVLLMLALLFWLKKDEKKIYAYLAGVILGIVTLIKIFPIIIILYLLLKKQYKIVLIAFITILILTACSGLIVGFDKEMQYYFKKLPAVFNWVPVAPISIPGFIRSAFSVDSTAEQLFSLPRKKIELCSTILTASLALATFLYVWLLKNYSKQSKILEFSLLIVLTLLISGSVHRHYILWCLPILFYCFYYAWQNKHYFFLALTTIGYFLLNAAAADLNNLGKIKYIGSLLIAPNFYGLVIIFITLLFFIWREHCCAKS